MISHECRPMGLRSERTTRSLPAFQTAPQGISEIKRTMLLGQTLKWIINVLKELKGKCGNAEEVLILGGLIYWECLHLSLMYRKQVLIFGV